MRITRFTHAVGFLATALVLLAPAGGASPQNDVEKLKERFPAAAAVRATPVAGIFELQLGYELRYVDAEVKYGFVSDLIDLTTGENLSEKRRRAIRAALVETLGDWDPIDFVPVGAEYQILVFTDVDCGYCRRFHSQMPEYNEAGIGIRYLAYPRAGKDSETWKKMEAVWCAEDRQLALTEAKAGMNAREFDCTSDSVDRHARLGNDLGLRGTPMMLTSDGRIIPGYVPPAELKSILAAEGATTR